MPYKNKEDYNRYLRGYMRNRRSVKPVLLNPVKPKPKRRDMMTAEELGITGHDADGNPLYE